MEPVLNFYQHLSTPTVEYFISDLTSLCRLTIEAVPFNFLDISVYNHCWRAPRKRCKVILVNRTWGEPRNYANLGILHGLLVYPQMPMILAQLCAARTH